MSFKTNYYGWLKLSKYYIGNELLVYFKIVFFRYLNLRKWKRALKSDSENNP